VTTALLRCHVIGKPTTVTGKRVFEFGLMAMPAKPVDRRNASRRMIHDLRFDSATMSAGLGGDARVEYPVAGNLEPNQGTLEVRFFADWDAVSQYPDPDWRWYFSRRLLKIGDGERYAMLFWNAHTRAWSSTVARPAARSRRRSRLRRPCPGRSRRGIMWP